jgi:uncharacterized protein YqeY
MSETKARLTVEMKEAMKSGQKERLGVIRMLITEIRNAEINDSEVPGRARTEEEALTLILAYHKSLTKSILEYPADRQSQMQAELKIVEEFLPKRLSPEELRAKIAIEIQSTAERNFGALMKVMQAKFGSQSDGKTISEILKAALAEG